MAARWLLHLGTRGLAGRALRGVGRLATLVVRAARRSRLVWLLALVLAPFVAALQYTTQVRAGLCTGGALTPCPAAAAAHLLPAQGGSRRSFARHRPLRPLQALEIEAFVQRIMPPLLEQNYKRNTHMKRQGGDGSAGSAGGRGKPCGSRRERHGSDGGGGKAAGGEEPPVLPAAQAGSDQFAQNAEVLITGAGGGRGGGSADALAPPTPAPNTCGAASSAPGAAAPGAPVDKALLPRTNSASSAGSAGHRAKANRAARVGGAKVGCFEVLWGQRLHPACPGE